MHLGGVEVGFPEAKVLGSSAELASERGFVKKRGGKQALQLKQYQIPSSGMYLLPKRVLCDEIYANPTCMWKESYCS